VAGIEVAMTDSMAYADVVLPACTHFEHDDLYCAYGQQYLQRAEAVIPPVGESLPTRRSSDGLPPGSVLWTLHSGRATPN